jgi:replicative DNA helicase
MNHLGDQSIEAGVIGALLMHPSNLFFTRQLCVNDFCVPEHRVLFEAIEVAMAAGQEPSAQTLIPTFRSMNFGGISGAEYIARMLSVAISKAMMPEYVRSLKEFAGRRVMAGLADYLKTEVFKPGSDIAGAIALATGEMDAVMASLRFQRRTLRALGDIALESIASLESGEKPALINAGISDINKMFGGWHRGELAIIAGRTSMGKSAFLFSTLLSAAKAGTSSLVFSLEMRGESVSHRQLSDLTWNSQTAIAYERIEKQDIRQHEMERLKEAAQTLTTLPMAIDDQRGLTVAEIGSRVKRHQDDLARIGKTLDVVGVDHLGKIAATGRYAGQKVHETGEKTDALAILASELNVAMVVLQQLNRGVEGREDKRPGLSDLRDSGNIEEDADTVSLLYRPAYYLNRTKYDDPKKEQNRRALLELKRDTIEWIVPKNRHGQIGIVELFGDMSANAIRNSDMLRSFDGQRRKNAQAVGIDDVGQGAGDDMPF